MKGCAQRGFEIYDHLMNFDMNIFENKIEVKVVRPNTLSRWMQGVFVGVKHMLQSKKVVFLYIYTTYWAKCQ